MIKVILLAVSLAFAPHVHALKVDECSARLQPKEPPPEVREAFAKMRELGLNRLLSDVYDGKVEVKLRWKWPWQEAAVSGVVGSFTGRKSIVIRGSLDVSERKAKEKFAWDLALALFTLQVEPWLWSPESYRAESPSAEPWAGPVDWRDEHLRKAQLLLRELYALFMQFKELKAADVMPAESPAAYPNQRDFDLLTRQGILQVERAVGQRSEGPLLAGYYLRQARRGLVALAVVSNVLALGQLKDFPAYVETFFTPNAYEETVQQAPTNAEIVASSTRAYQREREIKRLHDRIALEEKRAERDDGLIERLKTHLQTLVERESSAK